MMYIRTTTSLLVVALVPTVAVAILDEKIGNGGGAIFLVGAFLYLPFILGAILALAARKRRWFSWLILLILLLISCDELIGIYGAFFRSPARGASDLIYRPLGQILVITVIAIVFGGMVLGERKWHQKPSQGDTKLND